VRLVMRAVTLALLALALVLALGCGESGGINCFPQGDTECLCFAGSDREQGACTAAMVDDADDDPDDTFCCASGDWPNDGECACKQVFCYDVGLWCECGSLTYLADAYPRVDTCAADPASGAVACTIDAECTTQFSAEDCAQAGGVVSDQCTPGDLRVCQSDWSAVSTCVGEGEP
jgi:hypothetical protein